MEAVRYRLPSLRRACNTIAWLTPSRDEGALGAVQVAETPQDRMAPPPAAAALPAPALVQGGMLVALRPRLWPEFHVHGGNGTDLAVGGIADAICFNSDCCAAVVVAWKSDVAPSAAMLAHNHSQVGSYVGMTGAARGLIVLVTSGEVIEVLAPAGAGIFPSIF